MRAVFGADDLLRGFPAEKARKTTYFLRTMRTIYPGCHRTICHVLPGYFRHAGVRRIRGYVLKMAGRMGADFELTRKFLGLRIIAQP